MVKAELVARINAIIRQRGIARVEAARQLLGLSWPDVSRLLRGEFCEYSLERLLRLLTALHKSRGSEDQDGERYVSFGAVRADEVVGAAVINVLEP